MKQKRPDNKISDHKTIFTEDRKTAKMKVGIKQQIAPKQLLNNNQET